VRRPRSARLVLAANLRRVRQSRRISQERLAELAGLHRTYVGSVERGERNISIDNIEALIEALATALKMTCADLLTDPKETAG
jgi:transcriptional regulator with XRE-family HTH domain